MPSIKALKPGDAVVGVVVGVMPFGVFVELAPDCSGLVHVSRVSDTYVEDLHEAVQVGDVVSAWVTGIDEKRRRVALSAVSPQREAELAEVRRSRDDRSRGGQADAVVRHAVVRHAVVRHAVVRDAVVRDAVVAKVVRHAVVAKAAKHAVVAAVAIRDEGDDLEMEGEDVARGAVTKNQSRIVSWVKKKPSPSAMPCRRVKSPCVRLAI